MTDQTENNCSLLDGLWCIDGVQYLQLAMKPSGAIEGLNWFGDDSSDTKIVAGRYQCTGGILVATFGITRAIEGTALAINWQVATDLTEKDEFDGRRMLLSLLTGARKTRGQWSTRQISLNV